MDDNYIIYTPQTTKEHKYQENIIIKGLDNPEIYNHISKDVITEFKEELELVAGASTQFDHDEYLKGKLTPVYFGSALNTFGIKEVLDGISLYAPSPKPRDTSIGTIEPNKPDFSGFVFKIQANMDPQHRDRIAFMRIVLR